MRKTRLLPHGEAGRGVLRYIYSSPAVEGLREMQNLRGAIWDIEVIIFQMQKIPLDNLTVGLNQRE